LYPAALATGLIAAALLLEEGGWMLGVAALSVGATACFAMRTRPLRFALAVAAVLVFGAVAASGTSDVVERKRSFFGVHKVLRDRTQNAYLMVHGVTVHGTQLAAPEMRRVPTDYFYWDGPLGQLFGYLYREGAPRRVALVGLGAGASLCYRRPGDRWSVYEIDPAVEALARDTRFFHFVELCGGDAAVILGDARLSLAAPGVGPFDLIILDAFASDAVPAHLLTREAMALYRRLLAPKGLIAVHVTNKFMELAPVVAAAADAAGMAAAEQFHAPGEPSIGKPSRWVVVAADAARLAPLAAVGPWRPIAATSPPWTDDYWNILAAIRWGGADPDPGR
ncbi:MAG: spermidine synthase, partial [Rhodospirillales bacterium]